MNCNVTQECKHREKSPHFHSFTDENDTKYGLGFHKSQSGLQQAARFSEYMNTALKLHAIVGYLKYTAFSNQ